MHQFIERNMQGTGNLVQQNDRRDKQALFQFAYCRLIDARFFGKLCLAHFGGNPVFADIVGQSHNLNHPQLKYEL